MSWTVFGGIGDPEKWSETFSGGILSAAGSAGYCSPGKPRERGAEHLSVNELTVHLIRVNFRSLSNQALLLRQLGFEPIW